MSFIQQISIPLLFTLNILPSVDNKIVEFWADLDQFIRDLFARTLKVSDIAEIQRRGVNLLERAKALFPKIQEKQPHNIHGVLEYLFIDLPTFILGEFLKFFSSI